jgi:hypothetical protein
MTCVHLTKLYQLCQKEGIRLSGSDLIHVVCDQCGEQEVCPSMLMEEYDARAERREEKEERREEKGER